MARLRQRGVSPDLVPSLIAELEAHGHLDDARFARAWVESRARGQGAGPARLRGELRARGVASDLIEAAIRETFAGGEIEESAALELGRKRFAALTKGDPRRVPVRLRDYLLRRGYAAGVVARVVRTLCRLEPEELGEGES